MLLIVETLKYRHINFKNEKLIRTFIMHTPKLRATDIGAQYKHVHTPEFRTTDIKLSSIHMYSHQNLEQLISSCPVYICTHTRI